MQIWDILLLLVLSGTPEVCNITWNTWGINVLSDTQRHSVARCAMCGMSEVYQYYLELLRYAALPGIPGVLENYLIHRGTV